MDKEVNLSIFHLYLRRFFVFGAKFDTGYIMNIHISFFLCIFVRRPEEKKKSSRGCFDGSQIRTVKKPVF